MSDMVVGHVLDVGSQLRLRVKNQAGEVVSLAMATKKEIWLKKPGRIYVKEDATFATDGTDGILMYTFDADDLATPGIWLAQVYVELPSSNLHSSHFEFVIEKNLE